MPYLEVTKNQEEENLTQIEMPDITGITLKEAKIILKELGLDYEINIDEPETIITNQVPKKGIKVNSCEGIGSVDNNSNRIAIVTGY